MIISEHHPSRREYQRDHRRRVCQRSCQVYHVLLSELEFVHDVHGVGRRSFAHVCLRAEGRLPRVHVDRPKDSRVNELHTQRADPTPPQGQLAPTQRSEHCQRERQDLVHAKAAGSRASDPAQP